MIAALYREATIPGSVVLPVVFFPVWLGGGALIGVGLSRPFGRWRLGIVVVWALQTMVRQFVFGPNY